MDSRFWILLKVQLKETFLPAPKPETSSSRRLRRRHADRSGASYLGSLVVSWLVIAVIISMYMGGIAQILEMMGALKILPLIGIAGGSIMVLITTVYKTNGLLFGFKDYDMVSALPFRTSSIITCRFILLYVWNLFYTTCFMIPAGVIYSMFAAPSWGFWPVYILEILLTPLLPCVLAAIIGMVIGLIARHFKKRGFMGTILTITFMILWMLFCFNLNDDTLSELAALAPQIMNVFGRIYPPAIWAVAGCCQLNMGMFALFAGVSIGAFAAFVAMISPNFKRINAALSASLVAQNYKLTTLRGQSGYKALVSREWKRIIGSSTYFMNSCMGYILMIVFSAIVLFAGASAALGELSDLRADVSPITGLPMHMDVLLAVFFSLFAAMSATTISSISLEGKQLWIIKSLPLRTWDILRSKLDINIRILLVATATSAVLLWLSFPDTGVMGVMFFLIPFVYGLWAALWGLFLGLKYADFDWTTEVKAIKQGKGILIMTFADMALVLLSVFATLFLGDVVAYVVTGVMALLCFLLYRSLRTKGVRIFDGFSA